MTGGFTLSEVEGHFNNTRFLSSGTLVLEDLNIFSTTTNSFAKPTTAEASEVGRTTRVHPNLEASAKLLNPEKLSTAEEKEMDAKMRTIFFIVLVAIAMIVTSGCSLPASKAPAAPVQVTVVVQDPTMVAQLADLGTQVAEKVAAHAATATKAPAATATATATATPKIPAPTRTSVPKATDPTAATQPVPVTGETKFDYDLFDRGNGLCFVVERQKLGDFYRVLEFLYGLRIEGDTLVEYAPAERGSDEGTWPPQVVLVGAKTDRQTDCGEVEARHPINYRIKPVGTGLTTQLTLVQDVDNSAYSAAYKAASVGSDHLGLFVGSEQGADVRVRVYDQTGKLLDEQFHRVAGSYCIDCRVGTSLNGQKAQYSTDPEDFAFSDSTRKVLTTDLLALALEKGSQNRIEITLIAKPGATVDVWTGELRPLSVTPTPTATAKP